VQPHATLEGRVISAMSFREWEKHRSRSETKLYWHTLFDRTAGWSGRLMAFAFDRASSKALSYAHFAEYLLEECASDELLQWLHDFERSRYANWVNYIPKEWFENPFVFSLLVSTQMDISKNQWKTDMHSLLYDLRVWLCFVFCTVFFGIGPAIFYLSFFYSAALFVWLVKIYFAKRLIERRLVDDHSNCGDIFKKVRDNYGKYFIGTAAVCTSIYAMYKLWKSISFGDQGVLSPTTVSEIEARDKEENVWAKVETTVVDVDKKDIGGDDRVERLMSKHTVSMLANGYRCNALIVASNVVMMPMHIVDAAHKRNVDIDLTCTRMSDEFVNARFRKVFRRDDVVRIADYDLALVNVDTTGSVKGILNMFPNERPRGSIRGWMLHRQRTGEVWRDNCFIDFNDHVNNGVYDWGETESMLRYYPGANYTLSSRDTFNGLCCSPVIAMSKNPYIASIHLGGKNNDKRFGCGATPLASEVRAAMHTLQKDPTHFQAAQASEEYMSYGTNYIQDKDIHAKCPTCFLEPGANMEILGSCGGKNTFDSKVETSVISESVCEVMQVPNQWGPPKGKGPTGREPWHPWRESLKYSSRPSIGIPERHLRRAMENYLRPLKKELKRHRSWYANEIRPLTRVEIVSGRDGKRFIDQMNMSTSRGFPLSGPKSQDVLFLEPTEEHTCPRTFTDELGGIPEI
jgi:hypothetical protein